MRPWILHLTLFSLMVCGMSKTNGFDHIIISKTNPLFPVSSKAKLLHPSLFHLFYASYEAKLLTISFILCFP